MAAHVLPPLTDARAPLDSKPNQPALPGLVPRSMRTESQKGDQGEAGTAVQVTESPFSAHQNVQVPVLRQLSGDRRASCPALERPVCRQIPEDEVKRLVRQALLSTTAFRKLSEDQVLTMY